MATRIDAAAIHYSKIRRWIQEKRGNVFAYRGDFALMKIAGFFTDWCDFMFCQYCSSSQFRRSRLHRDDLLRLFALRFPVRCRNCHHRAYAGLLYARTLPGPPEKLHKASAPTPGA